MTKQTQLQGLQPDLASFFARICIAYMEALVGLRRPEQLSRWLSDKVYNELCQRSKRESQARQLTGLHRRPEILLRKSRTFLTDDASFHGVVLLQISGATRAVSIRAQLIHSRFRITDIDLVANP